MIRVGGRDYGWEHGIFGVVVVEWWTLPGRAILCPLSDGPRMVSA